MLRNTFSLSGTDKILDREYEASTSVNFERDYKDELTGEIIVSIEKAEQEVWLGVKSEKEGNLKSAIFHYRSAIKSYPECVEAGRLLANALKKANQAEVKSANSVNNIEPQTAQVLVSEVSIDSSSQVIEYRHPELVKRDRSQTVYNRNPPHNLIIQSLVGKNILFRKNNFDATTLDFSNVKLMPINTNINVNNSNSLGAQNSVPVVLPNLEMSPSGDLVLQENLSVAKVYVEQAIAFFDQKQWEKSIAACKEALRICPNIGEAYKIWGNCLQQSGNSADAIGIYAKALELQPNMAEIYCNLGSIYAKSKKWQLAIEHYQKSIIIDPKCAAPYRNLAKVWDKIGEHDKSEECFFKALEVKPQLMSAKNHFELAHNLSEENKIDKAIACYKYCLEIEPKFLNAYVRLAQILEKMGKTEDALYYYKKLAQLQTQNNRPKQQSKSRKQIRSFLYAKNQPKASPQLPPQKSLRLDGSTIEKSVPQLPAAQSVVNSTAPAKKQQSAAQKLALAHQKIKQQPNSPSAYVDLGNLYFLGKQWQKAIACYVRAIKLDPKQAKYYINLGKAWSKAGDDIKANQVFYQGFSLEPDRISAQRHFLLGNKLFEQRQLNLAISCYRRAITQEPKLVEAYWQLGKISQVAGRHQMAISSYQQALKVDPKKAYSYFLLGNALTQAKQWQPALSSYQKAASLEPDNADIQHNLGETHSQLQQWSNAIEAYQKAIALYPKNSWSYHNLGNAQLKREQYSKAVQSFRVAIKLKPDFMWSHYNLGEALSELEQWDEALLAYQSAQKLDSDLPEIQRKIGAILHERSKRSQLEALSFCMSQLAQDPDNIDLYHQAISLDQKNHELYLGLGKALLKQNKIDEAISIFQIGSRIQPRNLELTSALSEAILLKNPELDLAFPEILQVEEDERWQIGDYSLEIPTYPEPIVSIIIPVYNQIDYTFKCLHSIVQHTKTKIPIEVIVINDCSTDNTVDVLKQVKGLKRIDNAENIGFLLSCNQGITAALGKYVYFLNNDTELRPGAVEHLVSTLEQDPQVGAVGSQLIYPDGTLQEAGGLIWQDGSGWNYGRQENALAPQYNYQRQVDYCSGASLMVRKSALTALDGFDSDFAPAYYEDTDLCFAIRHRLGLKVIYQPRSQVVHYEGISCGTDLNNGIKRYQSLNHNKFVTKWQTELKQYPANTGQSGVAAASRRHLGRKTILVIDIYTPCYDRESGARRIWELLQIFKQLDYHVIFVPDNGAKSQPYTQMLQQSEIEVVYTEPGYGISIEEQLSQLLPLVDIAWVCRPQLYEKYAPTIRQHEQIKLVYDTVDLHYLRLKREGELSNHKDLENMRSWIRMQSKELKAAHQADLTIAITEAEQEILREQQVNNVAVVPNIHSSYQGEKPSFNERQGILFIGSYNHPPNLDAVNWLVKEIMPMVWQQIPELTITLLGSNTTDEVLALKSERVKVTGYIADVTPYFLNHRVFVAPLRYGAGMKGKIGQSLEYGLPIVSTAIGVEGMDLTNTENVLEANRPEEFARAIIRLYQDRDLWQKLAVMSENALSSFTTKSVQKKVQSALGKLMKIKF